MHRRMTKGEKEKPDSYSSGILPTQRTDERIQRLKTPTILVLFIFLWLSGVFFASSVLPSDVSNLVNFQVSSAEREEILPSSRDTSEIESTEIDQHTIFSTSCTPQQNWESYVLFFHALKVKQPGNVTRIASGCSDSEAKALIDFHNKHIRTMSDRFHIHLTDDFSRVRLDSQKHAYKYMNKPFGVRHWMEHVLRCGSHTPEKVNDAIIVLMDPDMILLRPLKPAFEKEQVIWVERPDSSLMHVSHGRPMAQHDGYLHNKWLEFNMTFVTGDPSSPAYRISPQDARDHYNAGPPYLATVKDLYNIAVKWTEYAPRGQS